MSHIPRVSRPVYLPKIEEESCSCSCLDIFAREREINDQVMKVYNGRFKIIIIADHDAVKRAHQLHAIAVLAEESVLKSS